MSQSPGEDYKSISLFSITPDEPLPFDVSIHYKGRYLLYRKAGQVLEVSRFNRFVYKRIGQLYVNASEYARYQEYVAQKSAEEQKRLTDPALPPERIFANKISHEIKSATRDLFIIDNDAGRAETVKRVLTITQTTVQQVLSKPYIRIFESLPDKPNDVIAHSTRVSLLATYLAYQLGYVNPVALEYLAAAAMLHDIGKTKIALSDDLELDEGDQAEAELMKQHPNVTCEMLKDMPFVPEEILRIIREHHEFRDGSGYPNGIRGPKMFGLSRVFVIANTFDNLANDGVGSRDARVQFALHRMTTEMRNKFDPVLLPKAVKLLGFK